MKKLCFAIFLLCMISCKKDKENSTPGSVVNAQIIHGIYDTSKIEASGADAKIYLEQFVGDISFYGNNPTKKVIVVHLDTIFQDAPTPGIYPVKCVYYYKIDLDSAPIYAGSGIISCQTLTNKYIEGEFNATAYCASINCGSDSVQIKGFVKGEIE